MTSSHDRYRSIRNVLWVVLALNLAVALAKLVYGVISHSAAMEADGFHSLFDGASNIIGLVGMWFAARPADDDHPYGHSKYETFAAALIGLLLIVAGFTVGRGALDSLLGAACPPRSRRSRSSSCWARSPSTSWSPHGSGGRASGSAARS